jgi:hypothetical protein
MKHEERVIKAWQHIEQLNPYKIKTDQLMPLRHTDQLPWAVNEGANNIYKIYIGVFLLSEFYSEICDYFKLSKAEERIFNIEMTLENTNEQSCFATILVDSKGKYIKNSLETSVMPLALGKIENEDKILPKTYHESVDLELMNTITYFNSYNDIKEFADYLCKVTGFSPEKLDFIYWEKIKTSNKEKYEETIKNSTPGILNSFYLDDLSRVLNAVKNDNVGPVLSKYLSDGLVEKTNVEKIETIKTILTSDSIPYARWPNNIEHSLSLMQSVAVNKALDLEQDLFSVNGPPGTGKTTLLKDIIANLIFKRAELLSKYNDPSDIFESIGEVTFNNYSLKVHKLEDALKKYSIVIASSNNGAVENISKELPRFDNIADDFVEKDEYFTKVSNRILGEKTWGLLSAAFGNSSNINSFFGDFWFNEDAEGSNMREYLKEDQKISWTEAVNSFREKRKAVEDEISRIKVIEVLINRQQKLIKMLKIEQKKYKKLNQDFRKIHHEKKNRLTEYNRLTKEREMVSNEKSRLYENRPWWIFSVLNRKYYNQMNKMKARINETMMAQQKIREEINTINEKVSELENEKDETYRIIETFKAEGSQNKVEINKMVKDAGSNFVDKDFWNKPYKAMQMSSPWLYKKLNKLRSELFIESLRLHKAMILGNSKIFLRDIIPGIINLLNNNLDLEDAEEYGDAIWNNFFLVVPVISSTFASFQNMGKYLKRESIGWLLIDEAGQAIPQAAVGGIWRSQNVVAVGDPLQIQPVVTTPNFLFSRVKKHFDLDEKFLSKISSVQLIIDQANQFGGKINNKWVGCPLNVHRRCIDPMFSISNMIAYENKMVCATKAPKESDIIVGNSYWIDIKGHTTSKHYVKAQGEMVKEVLKHKFGNSRNPNVYIISPFKDVVNHLKKDIGASNYSREWINNSIGTIHTFQGKEEKAVILCLGLDKGKEGAVQWASKEANILNVAVSRAKYELLVIGDLELWGNKSNFDVASRKLEILNEKTINDFFYY